MSEPRFIKRIDWSLLKDQKADLVSLTYAGDVASNYKKSMQGIINLIDSLQDYAVDSMGLEEDVVFPPHTNPVQRPINKI